MPRGGDDIDLEDILLDGSDIDYEYSELDIERAKADIRAIEMLYAPRVRQGQVELEELRKKLNRSDSPEEKDRLSKKIQEATTAFSLLYDRYSSFLDMSNKLYREEEVDQIIIEIQRLAEKELN